MVKPRARQVALGVLLVVVVASAGPSFGAGADADLVIAALHVLQQQYVKPVQPVTLLNVAVESLRKTAHADLPDIPKDTSRFQAEQIFRRDFAKAVQTGVTKEEDLAYQTAKDMLTSLHDTHTFYLDPAQYQERQEQYAGRPGYAGIGSFVAAIKDAEGAPLMVYVASVFPGSPAAAAGLQRFDQFTQVDGTPVASDATPLDVVKLVRGPIGTTVIFTVRRKGQTITLTATRQAIRTPVVSAEMIRPGVAYLHLFQFVSGAADLFRNALRSLQARGPLHGLILDLRENGGGLYGQLQPIAGALLPTNTVLAHALGRQGPFQFVATGAPLLLQTRLVVLTDGNTASSAEVLSLALHDAHRAILIGERTQGALGDTVTVPLSAGGMGVTVAEVDGPRYEQVEGVGISPDEAVPLTVEDVSNDADPQLDAALAELGAGN